MLKKAIPALLLLCISTTPVTAQAITTQASPANAKLIVGLVIDQMRWDYLYRYKELYSSNGFRRLLQEGFSCENTMIPYTPTYTAPGHTCVYTGSVPAIHGIVGNSWYSRLTKKYVYCTDDSTVSTVGSNTDAGKMSPGNMWTTTITDELRLSNNFKSKVIGIALKDRGAILPAGHSANAAYWYDDKVGKFITSTHYMPALPQWVSRFNDKDLAAKYMSQDWNTLLPLAKYDLSGSDDVPFEWNIKGEKTVTFPHKLSTITKDKYEAFKTTPFANTYTFDFAKAAIENESLGKNTVTDFLTVSISSTDYIGHSFGPNSVEAEDTYLRLDKDIAEFLAYLDNKVGKGKYLIFLTADHGAAHVPAFLAEHKIPGGGVDDADIKMRLLKAVEEKLNIKNAIDNVVNYQVYLSDSAKNNEAVRELVIEELKRENAVATAVDLNELAESTLAEPMKTRLTNGYMPSRSGDIQFIFKPGYFDGGKKGTTHGLWNPYDSHIPLLFYGWGIKAGKLNRETYMTDIAATLAALLQIQMPSGCVGNVITEVMK
ncbi:MAG: alkaline phosphatase family protein [Chitinophagaceae bacterium]|nr:alkaline phosphatase family protein [Chitinophagaceae bacterium]